MLFVGVPPVHQLNPYNGLANSRFDTLLFGINRLRSDGNAYELHFVATSVFSPSNLGLCQPPSPAMIWSASIGPHVFGSYSWTGVAFLNTGSTALHAASTPPSRTNNVASPRMASPSRRSYGVISSVNTCRTISSTPSPTIASPGTLTRAPTEIATLGLRRKR